MAALWPPFCIQHFSPRITEDEVAAEVGMSAFRNLTGSIIDTHTAVVVLSIAAAAEIGGLLMVTYGKYEVQRSLGRSEIDVWIYSAIGVFLVGFLCMFPTYFLVNEKWPRPEAPFMFWPVSVLAGLGNVAMFYMLVYGWPRF